MPIIRRSDLNKGEQSSPGLESITMVDAAHGSDSLRVGEVTIAAMSRVPRHTTPTPKKRWSYWKAGWTRWWAGSE